MAAKISGMSRSLISPSRKNAIASRAAAAVEAPPHHPWRMRCIAPSGRRRFTRNG
jgi:hypothetical protein